MRMIPRAITPALLFLSALVPGGCSSLQDLPPGTQLSSASWGLKISPADPTGTPVVVGSHNFLLNVPEPGEPALNRFEGSAPFARWKATTASGPIGEQMKAAGGPEALGHLVAPIGPSNVPSLSETVGALPAVAQPPDDGG